MIPQARANLALSNRLIRCFSLAKTRRSSEVLSSQTCQSQASMPPNPILLNSSSGLDLPENHTPASHAGMPTERTPYWQSIGMWKDVPAAQFSSYAWQKHNTIDNKKKLLDFLEHVLPEKIPRPREGSSTWYNIRTREDFLRDVVDGMRVAPMAVRLTPHTLSVADWNDPIGDPIRRQFIPLKSLMLPDHPDLEFDSLHEKDDSPVPGLVHRYPDKVLFLATSVCPVYCRFCTRSYAIGKNTDLLKKTPALPALSRWNAMFDYIAKTPQVQDVVVSGGDSYYLDPHQLRFIGERLLSIPSVQRLRFATKGLAVCPMRIVDSSDDWTATFIDIVQQARARGKEIAMHTHFNHPNEITWMTALAAQHLFRHSVPVRNQTVLLRYVNDDVPTMSALIRRLADLHIQPYYVYQADMVRGVEDLRTPLSTILRLERNIRGTIAGFMTPSFVVDLPGGGGKRLANSFDAYNEKTGVSTFRAPGVAPGEVFTYRDPVVEEGV